MVEDLRALGAKSEFQFEHPDPTILEWFPNPQDGANEDFTIEIVTDEFSSLCPKTHQPDWATIVIRYSPYQRCVESKSLKLYLAGYRNHGEFHESCVNRIMNDLVALLAPIWMTVEGRFTPRGGIKFWPISVYGGPVVDSIRETLHPIASSRLEKS